MPLTCRLKKRKKLTILVHEARFSGVLENWKVELYTLMIHDVKVPEKE